MCDYINLYHPENKIEQMFDKYFKNPSLSVILNSRNFDQCFCSREGNMNKEEYKQHIIDAVKQIDDIKYLNRILNYVMKYLARSGK